MADRNRLGAETSPYLLQHRDNPVFWQPWDAGALEEAAREDRPILLSIGYSSCHWCHVMERECFANPVIATLMNEFFVCIKVDREERPDLDHLYMAATQALTGRGGWPMTVFLTPEQTPFFAGTYFPPEDREGQLGFPSLLQRIGGLWRQDRDQLFRQAAELTEHIQKLSQLPPPRDVGGDLAERALGYLERTFDGAWGGFGAAPKFPQTEALQLLLRAHYRQDSEPARRMLVSTLRGMMRGGLYDHLGGGFFRYSTDDRWLVPHFEKMLCDNALLARVYLEAFQALGDPEYLAVAEGTLRFIQEELSLSSGAFGSSLDADSGGGEGRYYVFTPPEVGGLVEADEAVAFCAYYGVTEEGNWEGRSVLHRANDVKQVAQELKWPQEKLQVNLDLARPKMLAGRRQRPAPSRDDKVITAWNALALGALAEAFRVTGQTEFLLSAQRAADFILEDLVVDGILRRSYQQTASETPGFLEDYAFLSSALLDLYEAGGGLKYLGAARRWGEQMVLRFADEAGDAFFQTAHDQVPLIVRVRDGQDGAIPNATAIAATVLSRLAWHYNQPELAERARAALRAYGERMHRRPHAFLSNLVALDLCLAEPIQFCFSAGGTASVEQALGRRHLPHRCIAFAESGAPQAWATSTQERSLLQVCVAGVCEAPVEEPAQLARALDTALERAHVKRRPSTATKKIAGRATPEGTRAYFSKRRVTAAAVRTLPGLELRVSRLGFGAYRVSPEDSDHAAALALALQEGCNLIDTASSYGSGGSEEVIGRVLGEAFRQERLARDEVVVISKFGIVQGAELPTSSADRPDGYFELNPKLGYCLTPALLQRQLDASLERLGLEALDVALLHNPEMVLTVADRAELMQQLTEAFRWLESIVETGRLSLYGLSSNSLGQSGGLTFLELQNCAERAGAKHFRVLQLPLNPLEQQPRLGTSSILSQAEEHGLFVLTNRPLNALVGDTLVRLAQMEEEAQTVSFEEARQKVSALEHEFRVQLGAVLKAVPGIDLPVGEFFTWSDRIGATEVSSRELWNEFERDIIAHQLPQMVLLMNGAFEGKELGQVWGEWRRRYLQRFEEWILTARHESAQRSNQRNKPLLKLLRETAPEQFREATLSRLVLWNLSSLEGVGAVLCGMRNPSHVQDALGTLRWPEAVEPESSLDPAVELGLVLAPPSGGAQ